MATVMEKTDFGHHLALPVTVITEPIKPALLDSDDPRLGVRLAEHGMLPVIDKKKRLVGILRESDALLNAHAQLALLRQGAPLEKPFLSKTATVHLAVSEFQHTDLSFIPMLDEKGRYTGQCVSRLQLYKLTQGLLRPQRIGGMATPLGVYMTSGCYSSGAGWKGLVSIGVLLGLMTYALDWFGLFAYSVLGAFFPEILFLPDGDQALLQNGLILVSLLMAVRLTPISGLHAAEHMTINAMERDLTLSEPIVRTQPRVHKRCGTNLMVLLVGVQVSAFSIWLGWERLSVLGLTLYLALWVGLLWVLHRYAGVWLQTHFTTRPPTSAQLASGLRAGNELLEKFAAKPHPRASIWQRIWGSGLPITLASFLISAWLFGTVLERFGLSTLSTLP